MEDFAASRGSEHTVPLDGVGEECGAGGSLEGQLQRARAESATLCARAQIDAGS
jgi:hypothetical protein